MMTSKSIQAAVLHDRQRRADAAVAKAERALAMAAEKQWKCGEPYCVRCHEAMRKRIDRLRKARAAARKARRP